MPSLDPCVAMYRYNIKPDAKLVKQHQRRFHPELMEPFEDTIGLHPERATPLLDSKYCSVSQENGKI